MIFIIRGVLVLSIVCVGMIVLSVISVFVFVGGFMGTAFIFTVFAVAFKLTVAYK